MQDEAEAVDFGPALLGGEGHGGYAFFEDFFNINNSESDVPVHQVSAQD